MIQIEIITPKYAAEILEMNTANRPVSEFHVKALADAMAKGEWQFNGDSIRIAENNSLLDGQHRLLACIRSGVPLRSYIIRGIDPEAFTTIDSGKKRSGADTLALMGLKNYTNLSSTLRVLTLHEAGRLDTPFAVSNTMIKDAFTRFKGVETFVDWVCGQKDVRALIQPSVCAAAYYLTSRMNRQDADMFFESVKTGESLQQGSPILALRSVMIRQRMGSVRINIDIKRDLLLILKAFSDFRSGRKIKSLVVGATESASLLVLFGGKS